LNDENQCCDYKVIDDNHVLVNCGKCEGTGIIAGVHLNRDEDTLDPCDVCGGEGKVNISFERVENDEIIPLSSCNKCQGTGLSGESEIKGLFKFKGACVLCSGVGIVHNNKS
jgi:DnaJ-class molecular chaperone|tara:strand:- start:501 stop:836 length:336 start_codon:yes stop_codon:yes gene_type:complete